VQVKILGILTAVPVSIVLDRAAQHRQKKMELIHFILFFHAAAAGLLAAAVHTGRAGPMLMDTIIPAGQSLPIRRSWLHTARDVAQRSRARCMHAAPLPS